MTTDRQDEDPSPVEPRGVLSRRWRRGVVVVLVVAVLVLAAALLVPTYRVPSASMSPLLAVDDTIAVNRTTYWAGPPRRGDVVVFRAPGGWAFDDPRAGRRNVVVEWWGQATGLGPADQAVVKRVVATGGDTVRCCDSRGRVVVAPQGRAEQALREPRGARPSDEDPFGPVLVPRGRLWLMGDNRAESADSRTHITDRHQGTVSIDDVVGRVFFRVRPLRDVGPVGSRLREGR